MKRICILAAVVAAEILAAAADGLRPLPWSAGLNDPARFQAHSSGESRITSGGKGVVRIEAEFPAGVDRWCYQKLTFRKPVENFEDAEELRFEIKFDPDPKGFRHVFLMMDGHPNYALPKPDGSWQKVAVNFKEAKIDPAGVSTIQIGANPGGNRLSYRLRNIEVLSSRPWRPEFDAAAVVVAAAPGTMFFETEPLSFSLLDGIPAPASWTLRDSQGNLIRTGKWPARGGLRLNRLPRGYYTLEFEGKGGVSFSGERSFGVVANPANRKRNPDSFFALDSAQSWLARADSRNSRHPQEGFETVSELAYRSGAAMVRYRLSWSETEPRRGDFRFGQYKTNAELLHKRGIPILGMYHNAPGWAKSATTVSALPRDLAAVYNYAKRLAVEFRGTAGAFEFWNEPDIYYTVEGAWDYASALKAAYLGYKAGNAKLPVSIAGIAKTELSPYSETLMKNAAGEYFDIYAIHSYRSLTEYPELSRNMFAFLRRYGLEARRVWMTENGCRAEGPARLESCIAGAKAHSPEQEMLVAEFLPKAMIQLQFEGFDRDFFFVLSPYTENGGSKDWGLMRGDFTAKPALIAYSNLTAELENAELEGEIDLGNPDVRGFLYRQPDGTRTLVYWTKSELDTEPSSEEFRRTGERDESFSLPAAGEQLYRGRNVFGTPFEVRPENGVLKLVSTRMPAFLSGLSGLEPTRRPPRSPERKNADGSRYNRSIVFQTELSNDFTLSIDRESADICRENVFLKLIVWNLSGREQSGTIELSGGRFIGLPAECAIPASGRAEYLLKFTPEIDSGRKGAFRAEGTFSGQPVSPLLIPLTCYTNLDRTTRRVELSGALRPENWRKNASGEMEISFDQAEKAIRFSARFAPTVNDRWFYPEYVLHLPEESLAGAIGISFETKAVPPYDIRQMLVMAVPGTEKEVGTAYFLKAASPGAEWETRTVSFGQHDFDPASIRMLRFGLNTTRREIDLLVRNVRILYAE
ncbi:hypothetical protein [uncultured Victivallis sp.]|uniref:hypothetical protein n=1 Tax=uncultured Victivallis sp. TaxID=354118 RepID=UPI0025D3A4AB|nr:hypothetical protein [uncultured Victivallis sp.]